MQELERIEYYYTKAISYYSADDPEAFLWMGRKTAEAICRQIFEKEISPKVGKLTLDKFIEELVKKDILPRSVQIPLRTIQDYGNFGAHDQGEESKIITKEYAQPCLPALDSLVKWYFLDYHKQTNIDFITHHTSPSLTEYKQENRQNDLSELTNFLEAFMILKAQISNFMQQITTKPLSYSQQLAVSEAWRKIASVDYQHEDDRVRYMLKEAEQVREYILREPQAEYYTTNQLKALSQQLKTLGDTIDKTLRNYQKEIVEHAIKATLQAYQKTNERQAGIIYQASGTGITLTTLAYLIRLMSLEEAHKLSIIVVVDRLVILDQLKHSLNRFLEINDNMINQPNNLKELNEMIESGNNQLFLITQQKIDMFSKREKPIMRGDILVVGFGLTYEHRSIKNMFPQAIFIHFSTKLDPNIEESSAIFGQSIYQYSRQQAIDDGFLTPFTGNTTS